MNTAPQSFPCSMFKSTSSANEVKTCKSCKWFVMCLHVYDWLLVVVVESNLSVHFCVQERDLFKWRMIIAVVRNFVQLRKESLKKMQACTTGFDSLTSAIPVQHSVNLAVAVISAMNFIEEWQLFAFSTKLSLLFTCLDLCSIGSLPSVPETFHARLPVSVKSHYRDPSKLCFLFWPWKCPRQEGVSLRSVFVVLRSACVSPAA